MNLKTLLTAAAATALLAGAAQAQTPPSETSNTTTSADAMEPVAPDTAVNPPEGTMTDPGTTTTEAAPAMAGAVDASATVTTTLVTNGPIADTPENRAKYGQPLSRAGKRTAARGN
ncbi:hypothetical protein M9M90_12530 [Phenylobacterium sp. LH3H17]|uniref:hypothetical protein n=1 Tax=Phenylobacterium sp. LH3H17 TaxID=2903901 RepID=UPI0020C9D52D|nr:hypothetical protein [Phenylobacterium sp. LH3H17]UTP38058.1 hypothetical protein M9M90_12530 [Phenylobacterium sp. LH3H17]